MCKQWLISATATTTTIITRHTITTTSAVNARRFLELRRHSFSVRKHLVVVAMFALTFTQKTKQKETQI